MVRTDVESLVAQFRSGSIDRRRFFNRAVALGLTPAVAGMLAQSAAAQDASPAATPMGEATRSISRDEFYAQLKEHFALQEPETRGGTLVFTATSDISTLNPTLVSDTSSAVVTGLVFEGLTGTSPIDGSTVPSGIADSWELAADGLTYTFHINPNARWHDGEPVTARDCAFSFDSVLAEDSLSFRKGTVEQFLASYRAIDDLTFELIANAQSAVFLENTTNQFAILPQHIWESVAFPEWGSDAGSTGDDPSRVVGSGPFRFSERALGSQVRVTRNEDYWDPENVPFLDELVYNIVADENSAVASLQTGETDITDIPSSLIDSVQESNPEVQIAVFDTTNFTYYMLNQDPAITDMFTDVRVRQALHYAIDRDTYVETIMNGYGSRADGTQPILSAAYAPDEMNTIYDFDPDLARRLMEEAGWIDEDSDGIREKDGQPFYFECLYPEGIAELAQGMPFLQQHWRDVGVEMIPTSVPWTTLLERIDSFQFEMALLGFSWGVDGLQGVMFRCDMVPFAGFNNMKYCNPEYDELDTKAQQELDPEARREMLIEATNIVNDEMAIGVLVFAQGISGAGPDVRNYHPTGYSGLWWLQYAWFDNA